MTGCDVPDALEAAHIHPYLGNTSNSANNYLLLGTEIHTIFRFISNSHQSRFAANFPGTSSTGIQLWRPSS
ncbi:TPA: HNH endonuclease [Stenotrophomonas maltophilia]|nr:HNH endonuclease [Stenotrophomonas maltophilia]